MMFLTESVMTLVWTEQFYNAKEIFRVKKILYEKDTILKLYSAGTESD